MKVNTLQTFPFPADYWDYRPVSNDVGGTVMEHFFAFELMCKVYVDSGGGIAIYSQVPLRIGGQLRNVRDIAGTVLAGAVARPDGYIYQITNVDPVLNPFGFVDTVRYTAKRMGA